MRPVTAFQLIIIMFVGACAGESRSRPVGRGAAIALAQRLHDLLDSLEVAGHPQDQASFYAEDVMRLDPNRTPRKGRAAFLSYAQAVRNSGYRVESAKTEVLDAWIEGTRLVEYGTALLVGRFGTAAAGEDPVNYLAVWRVNPADPGRAQIETIIWNAQKPMAAMDTLAVIDRPPG